MNTDIIIKETPDGGIKIFYLEEEIRDPEKVLRTLRTLLEGAKDEQGRSILEGAIEKYRNQLN